MSADVSIYAAFVAGLLSFFTPCILPLLPVYFGYLTGDAITNINNAKMKRKLMVNALGFVLGISLLNVFLGFGFRAVGGVLNQYADWMRYIGGSIMILFGLYFIIGIKWLFMERERKVIKSDSSTKEVVSPSFFKSFLLGITFSFGWTPCNGPILASILIIASFERDYMRSGGLMLVYSLGFAILFLLSALLVGVFVEKANKLYKYFGVFKKVAGGVMILMGILLILDKMSWLSF